MMRRLGGILVAIVLMSACQPAPEAVLVEITREGAAALSPGRADGVQDAAFVALHVTQPPGRVLTAYQVVVYDGEGSEVWRGGESTVADRLLGVIPRPVAVALPERLSWDGRIAPGGLAEDGHYTLVVEVWDSSGVAGRSSPVAITVDDTPPAADLYVESLVFSPDGDGRHDTITIDQRNASDEKSWTGTIRDALGTPVRGYTWPGRAGPMIWDGKDETGGLAPDSIYAYSLSATDEGGNTSSFTVEGITLSTRPVADSGEQARPIYFEPFTAVFDAGLDAATLAANAGSLERVAALLARFPELRLRVEGHAVRIHWNNTRLAPIEERIVLMPLSQKRAEAVRDALIERGVDPGRVTAVAQGGARPAVPHGELGQRWQNRRAVFVFLEPAEPVPAAAAAPEPEPEQPQEPDSARTPDPEAPAERP